MKTFNFALNIIYYTTELQEQKKFVITNQLLKSGTSIGANSKESQNAESKADFIHKLKITIKEADETEYWLFLYDAYKEYPNCKELIEQLSEILNKIISTSKMSSTR
nr:four helix bundle protein [Flavobacterium gelatinilyticum]